MADSTDKILQLEAALVFLQKQVDEMKSNAVMVTKDLKSDILRIGDEIEQKHYMNGERFHQLESKSDQQYHMNGEKIHLLEVNQAKIIQAVQFGGYFIKMIWGVCGAALASIVTLIITHLV
jgi:hypothetical protein